MIMSTPASRQFCTESADVQCAAVSVPWRCASSVIATSSATVYDARLGSEVRVDPPLATILM
jgi:hypothetical protein